MIIQKLLLIGVVGFAFILRFSFVSSNPPSMHADEADSGYTALSLITTGMDPYGNSWPLHFQGQAVNYRSPLYTYSLIPFVAVLGLSPTVERLPSVIFGTLFIVCIYFLLQNYFKSRTISLIGAFVAAINPWLIHLSRTGLEVQLSLLLTTAGILFFEIGKSKKNYFYLSAVMFGLSLFAYHPAKIFTPLILLVLFFLNFKILLKEKMVTIISIGIFLFFVTTLLYLAIFDKGASHFNEVSVFEATRAKEVVDAQRTRTNAPLDISSIFHNKPIYYLREFTNSYIRPLSVNYLFINGESNLDKGMGNYGQFHLFELLPFVVGCFVLWKKSKKLFLFFLFWILIALIPGGITKTGNYAYRDVNAIPPFLFLIALGAFTSFKAIYKTRYKLMLVAYFALSFVLFSFFVYNYYFAYPVYSRDWWGYSQKEALDYVVSNSKKYDSIVIEGGFDWPILYAFYYNIAPSDFQKAYKEQDNGVMRFDNIYFGPKIADPKNITGTKFLREKSLLIVPPDYYNNLKPDKIFYAVDGGTNLKAYEVE